MANELRMKLSRVLLLLPILFLFAFAAFSRYQEKQRAIENSKPFKIFLVDTKIVSSIGTNKTWRIEVRTFIDSEGRRPAWWKRGNFDLDTTKLGFLAKNGNIGLSTAHGIMSGWSEKRQMYYFTGVFNAGAGRSVFGKADFVAVLTFQNNGHNQTYRLQTPIGYDTQPFTEDRHTWMMNN